jgi:hypothetical protein
METIATMEIHPGIAGANGELTVLCEETKLGIYLVAAVAGGPHQSGESSTNNSGCRSCSFPEGG